MQFIVPHSLKSQISEIPPSLVYRQNQLIPFAKTINTRFNGGNLISQTIQGTDYQLYQHYLSITEPVVLYPYTGFPVLMLHYMLQGSVNCDLQGCGKSSIKEGQAHLIYVPPRSINEASFTKGVFKCLHIHLKPVYLEKLAEQYKDFEELHLMLLQGVAIAAQQKSLPISRRVSSVIQEIVNCREDEAERDLFIQARIRDLLLLYVRDVVRQNPVPTPNGYQSQILKDLLKYIEDNLDQPLAITDLARQAHLSISAFQKLFKHYLNKPAHRYILDLRMKKAKNLLLTTDMPVGEIAAVVSDLAFSNFTRAFRKYYGVSPTDFRKTSAATSK